MRTIKKIMWFLNLLLIVSASQAQLVIQPAVPRLGIIQKTQLWNLLVINTLAEEAEIRIDLTLQDRQTGHTLLTAQSGTLKLAKGAKQLNEQAVFPVQYKYESIFSSYNQQALLPIGNYLACYTIIRLPKQEAAGQECVAIDVAPLSPPMLIYPANNSLIAERSPQLSWIPPAPANLFSQLRYDVTVTELYADQSPEEAIQRNTPLFAMGSISRQSMAYPASAASLDTGKVYAWQVVAKNGESYAAKSDIWVFQLKKDSLPVSGQQNSFIRLDRIAAPAILKNGNLKVEYYHELNSSSIQVEIYRLDAPEKTIASFKMDVVYGQNFLTHTFKNSAKFQESVCYEAKFIIDKNKSVKLRFFPTYN